MTKTISQYELTKYILENVNKDTSDLDMKEYMVLVQLSYHLNSETLKCNPSGKTLSNSTFMHERTITEAINGLRDKGFITWVKGGLVGKLRKANNYALNFEKIYSCVKKEWEPVKVEHKIPAPKKKQETVVENPYNTNNTPHVKEALVNPLDGMTITKKFRRNGDVLLLDSFPPDVGLFEHNMWTAEERSKFVCEVAA